MSNPHEHTELLQRLESHGIQHAGPFTREEALRHLQSGALPLPAAAASGPSAERTFADDGLVFTAPGLMLRFVPVVIEGPAVTNEED